MLATNDKALAAINDYLCVIDRIQRENAPVWMAQYEAASGALPGWFKDIHNCETACCVAGWAKAFGYCLFPRDWAIESSVAMCGTAAHIASVFDMENGTLLWNVWWYLFGGGRDIKNLKHDLSDIEPKDYKDYIQQAELLARLNKTANFMKIRMENYRVWEANNQLPKAKRQDHMPECVEQLNICYS